MCGFPLRHKGAIEYAGWMAVEKIGGFVVFYTLSFVHLHVNMVRPLNDSIPPVHETKPNISTGPIPELPHGTLSTIAFYQLMQSFASTGVDCST